MTYTACLMGETPPGAAGTTTDAPAGGAPRAAGLRFAYARAVSPAGVFAEGTKQREMLPGSVRVRRVGLPFFGFVGSGPPFAFSHEPPPLAFAAQSALPLRDRASASGYQPEGMNPRARIFATSEGTSTTAIASSSAFATKSVLPSRESASAFGVEPSGRSSADFVPGPSGPKAIDTCRTTARDATSTTATRFRFAWATKSAFASGEKTRSEGWSAVFTEPAEAAFSGSTNVTVAPPHAATARSFPNLRSQARVQNGL